MVSSQIHCTGGLVTPDSLWVTAESNNFNLRLLETDCQIEFSEIAYGDLYSKSDFWLMGDYSVKNKQMLK